MRIKISKQNDELIDRLKSYYNIKAEGVIPRIAFAYSLQRNIMFNLESSDNIASDGREFRDDKGLFGVINNQSSAVIYMAILQVYYQREFSETDFIRLFKLHLNQGLNDMYNIVSTCDISKGEHVEFLLRLAKTGMNLCSTSVPTHMSPRAIKNINSYDKPVSFDLGKTSEGKDVIIEINNLNEFDNRNIAIAGMAGSGKTQLVKDILYQISINTNSELKFIFFDYKGEGNPEQLKPFLDKTNCDFVNILTSGLQFNPLSAINLNEGDTQRVFSIKAFCDTIATFVPSIGVAQKNCLQTIITQLIDDNPTVLPTVEDLFEALDKYYIDSKTKPDTLYAAIKDLATGIFKNDTPDYVLSNSIYLNLPPTLSDTIRQLCVFLLLRFFNLYFSSTNDVEPIDNIIPLRYIIVIDEAHIYLANKNARKALEELLRLLRSKGVVVIMLTQGVEDFKTKEFDFASQVKLPICLNVQNKDPRLVQQFLGTARSMVKLETELQNLESGKGLINISDPSLITIRQFWKSILEDTSY